MNFNMLHWLNLMCEKRGELQQEEQRLQFIIAFFLFVIVFSVYFYSPVYQVTDSNYSALVSLSLLEYGSFKLDRYSLQPNDRSANAERGSSDKAYQLESVGGHLYYYFPPGSSFLSVPYVAIAKTFGISAANPDGTYNQKGEILIEKSLAAILMAALTVVFFLTARLSLSLCWSVFVALSVALGTQLWSTASRGLWSHTWAILLVGLGLWMLVALEFGKQVSPSILASLLAWGYFTRPTIASQIICISIYLLIFWRRLAAPYFITLGIWLMTFVVFSFYHFGQPLPNYYLASRLNFTNFKTALWGNLISPSRGLLVYVPVTIFVFYLTLVFWRFLFPQRLACLAIIIILTHLVIISSFPHWWGGYGYGARFMTDVVPWFTLLAVLGLKAAVDVSVPVCLGMTSIFWGIFLLLVSIFINGRGALSVSTWSWNGWRKESPERYWDWKDAQFLAGLVTPPPPTHVRPIVDCIEFYTRQADDYLWYGWSDPEETQRWTDGKQAALIFASDHPHDADLLLTVRMAPFLVSGKLKLQRVNVSLNGMSLGSLELSDPSPKEHVFLIPQNALRRENRLTFDLPDAASPISFGISDDPRLLGVAVQWAKIERFVSPCADSDVTAQTANVKSRTNMGAVKLKKGSIVDLRKRESDKYLLCGWSDSEAGDRWTNGRRASLKFSVEEGDRGKWLMVFSVRPFLFGDPLKQQRVWIFRNGQYMGTLMLSGNTVREYRINLQELEEVNIITFLLPDACSPKELHISDDERMLGISLEWFKLEKLD